MDTQIGDMKQRRDIRFPPDPRTLAVLVIEGREAVGLILDESFRGCRVAIKSKELDLVPGTQCKAQVGKLAVVSARVAWSKQYEDVSIVGLEFPELGYGSDG